MTLRSAIQAASIYGEELRAAARSYNEAAMRAHVEHDEFGAGGARFAEITLAQLAELRSKTPARVVADALLGEPNYQWSD